MPNLESVSSIKTLPELGTVLDYNKTTIPSLTAAWRQVPAWVSFPEFTSVALAAGWPSKEIDLLTKKIAGIPNNITDGTQ